MGKTHKEVVTITTQLTYIATAIYNKEQQSFGTESTEVTIQIRLL